ncbi:MAG: kelch repeat-containing protein [Ignavibacteria bacterium]|nr:kelch repeat-containing protein [Ignavibacteria bacterium]
MKIYFTLFLLMVIISPKLSAGDDWVQKNPSTKPTARNEHAMCYISSGRVLLFGGYDGSSYLQDTWVYDVNSNTWTQLSIDTPPGVRSETGMAYIGNNQAILFGGKNSYAKLGDTWLFSYNSSNNTGTWTLKILAEGGGDHPYHRAAHAMAYAGNDDVILLGGVDYDGGKRQDTWHYDLTTNTWTQKADASIVIQDHSMCYIGGTKILWHGGATSDGSYGGTNIYDLSNNTWILKTSSDDLKLFESSSAYMGGDKVLLFGGVKTNGYRSDITWIYDESENTWTQDNNSTAPSARA